MNMLKNRSRSLYRELSLAMILLVTVASAIVALLNYYKMSEEVADYIDNQYAQISGVMAEPLEAALWNVDDELVAKIGGAMMLGEGVASVTIRDDQQRVVFHGEKTAGQAIHREFKLLHGDQLVGLADIGLSVDKHQSEKRLVLFQALAISLLFSLFLLAVMRWLLARLLKQPVDALVAATQAMVEGHLEQDKLLASVEEFSPILAGFKTMTEAVASREGDLRESRQLLNSVVENIPNMIFLKRASDLRFELFNRAGETLLGYDRADLLGKNDYDFFPRSQAELFIRKDRDVLAQTEVVDIPEEVIATAHGERILHTRKLALRDPSGNPQYLLGISEDITERKRAETELTRYKDNLELEVQQRTTELVLARDAAETANKAKSVFLANMSHELRTPLNAILGFSNLMRKGSALPREQRDSLDIINRSGAYLLNLINDVLEMAKIEAGRIELEHLPLDLGAMVRDVADMMQLRAREKGLRLLVEQSSELPRYIKGDEARLRQVIINLVGNAVKFTEQGGITVRFGLKPHVMPPRLLIEVEDSGVGIKPEDQQKLFEPFVQVGELAAQKGTGLGLAITRQFVQLMGGAINLESTPGVGSIFRVELPVSMVEAGEVRKVDALVMGHVTGVAPGQPEYRILIVEDQLENQLLLKQLMENIGLPVKLAENGEQGVQLFQSWQPHLIWMDRRMPVMDGMDATRCIRELPGGHQVKIVAVTASAFTEQREEMLRAGMDDFVRKPYRFSEIYECLAKQLGLKYTYEDKGTEVEEEVAVVLQPRMLAVLPQVLRDELRDALESLEASRIDSALERVEECDGKLHGILTRIAGMFDYPAILKALQEVDIGNDHEHQ
ncbi:MAG: ATP-binding protein [Gallionella sp.]|nr:ATP-binding protein [Gallionella sp.]